MKVAIIDYNAGNLLSVTNALTFLNIEHSVTNEKYEIEHADAIIFPGVGAFGNAMNNLRTLDLCKILRKQAQKKPFLGICLGMQLLFEKGYEFGEFDGLGLISGVVKKIDFTGQKIPHMGWNNINITRKSSIIDNSYENKYFYFVHSYKAVTADENIIAYSQYSERIPAVVSDGKFVFGMQFHPEKSGEIGLSLLQKFIKLI